jgi:hypothetical protein
VGYQKTADGTRIISLPQWALGQKPLTRTDNGSEQLNIDGTLSGTPTNVWDGTGAGDTGTDWTRSGEGSESTGAAYEGTNGLDSGVTSENDEMVFNKGSEIDVDGTYNTLQFWLQPKAYPTNSRLRVLWRNGSDALVGNGVLVHNYTSNMDLDVWQLVSIPIADFNLDADVQKLVFRCGNTSGQRYYLDTIEVLAIGAGPYRFQVAAPDQATVYNVKEVILSLAEENGTWLVGDFSSISGGLANGLILRQRQLSTSDVLWSINMRDNLELFGRLDVRSDVEYGTGVHQFKLALVPHPAVVQVTNDKVIEAVVRDDLTSINGLRAFIQYGEEVIT